MSLEASPPRMRPYRFVDFQHQSVEAKFTATFGRVLCGKIVLLQRTLSDEIWRPLTQLKEPGEACKENLPKRFSPSKVGAVFWLPATLAKLVSARQHSSGYFKRQFFFDKKQEVQELFSRYRHGVITALSGRVILSDPHPVKLHLRTGL